MEHWLGQVGSVLIGMIEGAIEREETTDSLEARTLDASGNSPADQGGDEVNVDAGASMGESVRRDSPMQWETGLIAQMEEEVRGWTWGVVQQESGGCPGELEWVQL